MRAARIHELGAPPMAEQAPAPEPGAGQVLVQVSAAPLNPIDLAIGGGRFYGGVPQVPYVPGKEGVGRVLAGEGFAVGTRVYVESAGGIGAGGTLAEQVAVDRGKVIPLPDGGVADSLAAGLGIAGLAGWLSVQWRAQLAAGETVLVLGASGAVGTVAVQAAHLLGAKRVVAAGRDAGALTRIAQLGADATVDLGDIGGSGDLAEAIQEAAGGPLDVVVDPLWGEPARAALAALAPGGRLVNLGQSAGAEVSIPSAAVRGKMAAILGFTVLSAPHEVKATALQRMIAHAAAGELRLEVEELPLEQAGEAWRRQAGSPHRKLVLVP